ncbi:GntR family transcriptional regulator [Streptomyces sp. NPDC093223]|uniref:GntR family transcriptional regulator n=1 Tax=Streptomyces sp. NPDC093223 TaxID=3366033 RepID=UPI0038024D80
MSPRVERSSPPYMQVTDHYRSQIQDGLLAEGDRIPAVTAIAREWGIAHATAAKAVQQLQVEGLITTSPRGSFVAAQSARATSPLDRLMRARRTGSSAAADEHHIVMAAGLVAPPSYVADLLDLEPNAQVARREWVTLEGKTPRALTVTWYPASMADSVPTLVSAENSTVRELLAQLEAAVGPITRGRDFYHARGADRREANHLGLPVGGAILAGAWLLWSGRDDLIEYGETCLPPRSTVSYPYEIPAGIPDEEESND